MDDQKRSSGVTRGLASPANQPAAATETKIPLVIVSRPSEAFVPAELIGIAVDYDPATVPEARHTSGDFTQDESVFRLADSSDEEESGNGDTGTSFSDATTAVNSNPELVADKTKVDKLDLKWPSVTSPSASPALAPANASSSYVGPPGKTIALELNDSFAEEANPSRPHSLLPPPPIRRGPVIRHDRLQHSETMASTRRVMDPMDVERQADKAAMKIRKGKVGIFYSYFLLLAASVALSSMVTTLYLFRNGTIPVLENEPGVITGAILGGIAVFVAAGLCLYSVQANHKNRENPVDSSCNSWIELQHRDKPLPPTPIAEQSAVAEQNAVDDNNPNFEAALNNPRVRAAFDDFIRDENGVIRYVYDVEEKAMGVSGVDRNVIADRKMHDILALAQPQSTTAGRATDASPARRRSRIGAVRMFSGANTRNNRLESEPEATIAPKASTSGKKTITKHAAKDSISTHNLLKNDSVAEASSSVPRSDTANMLDQLCDAVTATAPYDPISRVDTVTVTTVGTAPVTTVGAAAPVTTAGTAPVTTVGSVPVTVVGTAPVTAVGTAPVTSSDNAPVTTSRPTSRDMSSAAGTTSTGQRRWSRRGYANLTDDEEPRADPYNSYNYRRKGKGRAD